MEKYLIKKWDENQLKLQEAISKDEEINICDYDHLFDLIIKNILTPDEEMDLEWDETTQTWGSSMYSYHSSYFYSIGSKEIKEYFGDGEDDYYEYTDGQKVIITYADYGTCSICDMLMAIRGQCWEYEAEKGLPTEKQIKDYMKLCRDLICRAKIVDYLRYDKCNNISKIYHDEDLEEQKYSYDSASGSNVVGLGDTIIKLSILEQLDKLSLPEIAELYDKLVNNKKED